MPPIDQASTCCRRRALALAPPPEPLTAPTNKQQWFRYEPYCWSDSRCWLPFEGHAAALGAKLKPDSDGVLWFIPEAPEVFRGLAQLTLLRGETAMVRDVSEGKLRGTWPFQPEFRPVTLPAAHTARCAAAFKSRPSRADPTIHRLFAGQLRSQKALQHRYLAVVSALSGAELLDVECTKNAARFSVIGAEAAERVLKLSHRLRCVGDSVVLALRDDVDLNRMHVDHPTMLAGHAAPIEFSTQGAADGGK